MFQETFFDVMPSISASGYTIQPNSGPDNGVLEGFEVSEDSVEFVNAIAMKRLINLGG
jgi:hypothetical protein